MRFKALVGVPLRVLQGRFGVLKYLNRLVTPLLNYVDLTEGLRVAVEELGDTTSAAAKAQMSTAGAPAGGKVEEAPIGKVEEAPIGKVEEAPIGKVEEAPIGKVEEAPIGKVEEDAVSPAATAGTAVVPASATVARQRAHAADLSVSHIIHKLKGIYFTDTKMSVLEALLKQGATGVGKTPVVLHRLKASRAREDPKTDPHGLRSMFGQLFHSLRNFNHKNWRKARPHEQLFSVDFLGEGSIDVGGPYRESFTLACQDLMSDATPLFLPSPNRVNSVGLNREKYIINPAATSPLALQMFTFIGSMFGIALRTKYTLSLDLPSLVWKQVLGEPVDHGDLEAVDHLCLQALDVLRKATREDFEDMTGETFTTILSDGSRVELMEGGTAVPVTFANRHEFVEAVVKTRLHESEAQARAIRKGFNDVVPLGMLSLFSWREVERLVCGNSSIDVDALRRHTTYNGGLSATSPVVKMLFKALKSFTTEERQLFLRFVWGRNRLPSNDSDWTQHFVINTLHSSSNDPDANDKLLPVAHTCFFTIDLPNYTSYDILRSKVLYSIVNCQAIDTDFNPNASAISAWMDD